MHKCRHFSTAPSSLLSSSHVTFFTYFTLRICTLFSHLSQFISSAKQPMHMCSCTAAGSCRAQPSGILTTYALTVMILVGKSSRWKGTTPTFVQRIHLLYMLRTLQIPCQQPALACEHGPARAQQCSAGACQTVASGSSCAVAAQHAVGRTATGTGTKEHHRPSCTLPAGRSDAGDVGQTWHGQQVSLEPAYMPLHAKRRLQESTRFPANLRCCCRPLRC